MSDSRPVRIIRWAIAPLVLVFTLSGCDDGSPPTAEAAEGDSPIARVNSTSGTWSAGTPTYVNDESRRVAERLLDAHGGLAAWEAVGSLGFTANMYLASVPLSGEGFERTYYDNWRHYRVTIEPATSRGSIEMPLERPGEPRIGFDGTRLWSLPYDFDPPFRDPPLQMMFYHYSMVVLPFLTQQDDVVLELVGEGTLPGSEAALDILEMRFEPEGRVHEGHFHLYVDQGSGRLRGFRQTAPFPLLPGPVFADDSGAGNPPSMARLIDAYAEVGGLLIPRSYTTVRDTEDGYEMLGVHLVLDPEVSARFASGPSERPADARVIMSRVPGEVEEGG